MIIFILAPFSFGFFTFSSFVYMFSAPRMRQLDRWRFISLYYYYYVRALFGSSHENVYAPSTVYVIF